MRGSYGVRLKWIRLELNIQRWRTSLEILAKLRDFRQGANPLAVYWNLDREQLG